MHNKNYLLIACFTLNSCVGAKTNRFASPTEIRENVKIGAYSTGATIFGLSGLGLGASAYIQAKDTVQAFKKAKSTITPADHPRYAQALLYHARHIRNGCIRTTTLAGIWSALSYYCFNKAKEAYKKIA